MLRSMTAYSRSVISNSSGQLTLELQSLNRRHLDIQVNLPKEFMRFDGEVRRQLSSHLFRGQITARISIVFADQEFFLVSPNIPLARQYKAGWEAIASHLGLDLSSFSLSLLQDIPNLMVVEESEKLDVILNDLLQKALKEGLERLIEMKEQEGKTLEKDFLYRLDLLKREMDKIAQRTPLVVETYREKLSKRLEEALSDQIGNQERLLQEVVIFASRTDITEEVIRFNSHLVQFREVLSSSKEGCGKTLEFLLQELQREVNTIVSKASDEEISKAGILIKSELERMREQVQNIE